MTEKRQPKRGSKIHFLKVFVFLQKYFEPQHLLPHMKIESKIGILGKTISILHRQMTEQLSIEVDEKMVKNQKKCIF